MHSPLPNTGFLRLKQIIGDHKNNIPALIPVGPTTWWNGVKSGRYPKPHKIGARATAWKVEDIRKVMAEMSQCGTEVTNRAATSRSAT